jgi:pyruvate, orthophosphate dikinase
MTKNTVGENPDIIRIEVDHPPATPVSPAIVGGKAYGLLRMVSAGLNVPPGFVLGTVCSRDYFVNSNKLDKTIKDEIRLHVRSLEKNTLKSFGSKRNPLLVSVRSGAPVSMPGMMETLLNIGLNNETVGGVIRATGNPKLAWDSYRRLIQSYAEIVHSVDTSEFNEVIKSYLKHDGLKSMNELNSVNLRKLCNEFKVVFYNCTGNDFPEDPWKQLHDAITAVFDSWFSERAKKYRAINNIDTESGTACLIQSMVFGNAGSTSGSGVGFTRNPANGNNELYVDYLSNSQGEDIVSGRYDVHDVTTLQQSFPNLFENLKEIKAKLEKEFMDMQDFEFTVQDGELYLLQARNGKRTSMAALKIAIDLLDENLITKDQALSLLSDIDLDKLYQYKFKESPVEKPIATGTTASNGVATGIIALDENKAKQFYDNNKPVVLVRAETSTEDIGAMHMANAVVTVTGGRTSHAAVVARQLGIACVVGCASIQVDMANRCLHINDQVYAEGDFLTIDADHGHIYKDSLEIEIQKPEALLQRVQEWQKSQAQEKQTLTSLDA